MMPITTFVFYTACIAFAVVIFFIIAAMSANKDNPNELVPLAHLLDFVMKVIFSSWALYATIYFFKSYL